MAARTMRARKRGSTMKSPTKSGRGKKGMSAKATKRKMWIRATSEVRSASVDQT
jgi:hypothetical protein